MKTTDGQAVQAKRHCHRICQHGSGGHLDLLEFCLLESFAFRPPILKPDLDLGLCEVQRGRELGPFGDGEVLTLPELSLEGEQLLRREGGPWFAVGFVLPEKTFVRTETRRTADAWNWKMDCLRLRVYIVYYIYICYIVYIYMMLYIYIYIYMILYIYT